MNSVSGGALATDVGGLGGSLEIGVGSVCLL
jgi:hypothetical protein